MMDDIDIKYSYSIKILPFDGRSKSWHSWEMRQLDKSARMGWTDILRGKVADLSQADFEASVQVAEASRSKQLRTALLISQVVLTLSVS